VKLALHFGVTVDWLLDVKHASNLHAVQICRPRGDEEKPLEKHKTSSMIKTREAELGEIAEDLQAIVGRINRITKIKK